MIGFFGRRDFEMRVSLIPEYGISPGELVDVMPRDFQVVVEDGPEERTFLEYAQSGI